jgi:hypothetical protein
MISQVSRTAKQDLDLGTGKVGSETPFENKHNTLFVPLILSNKGFDKPYR